MKALPFTPNDPALIRDRAFIGGAWVGSEDGATFTVMDPGRGEDFIEVADCTGGDAQRAIAAAEGARENWRRRPAMERSALLRPWYELILANIEDLARLMTAEQGKPVNEARGE